MVSRMASERWTIVRVAPLLQGIPVYFGPALKNADSLLQDVLKAVDTDGNGTIEYNGELESNLLAWLWLNRCAVEFRKFVEHTEKELWQLFKSIDRNRNGQLDKDELRQAFLTAGIHLPPSKLDQFFSEVDTNHDGVITFDEWRYYPTQWTPSGDTIT